ncbi:Uridine kinase [Prosthecobacter debontii]|uniref:Uridine kinase n=1 Tax=Prosthecobacter debontii TaxID=48467 RepID=A0A1T4Z1V6_9BACT|nr:hypothetical protein [Prosthecobacter debontii]SKB08037.1 Uridine kinase [Prosthecobacter debontii]
MILVELAGAGGVGKSTIAPMIAQRLREELGTEAVAALPEKDVARRHRRWTRFKRWTWTAFHPRAFWVARRASKTGHKVGSPSTWLRAFTTMGIGRSVGKKGIKVALVDQGMLRLPMKAMHADLLPQFLLPDLVLHLVADPAVLEMRRIYRSKPKHNRYLGASRLTHAQNAVTLLQTLPPDQLRDAVTKFGEKFCEPPLTESEIEQLLQAPAAQAPLTNEAAQKGRCQFEVCETFRQRGVQWREIDNSHSMEEALEACIQAILTALAAGDAKGRPSSPALA